MSAARLATSAGRPSLAPAIAISAGRLAIAYCEALRWISRNTLASSAWSLTVSACVVITMFTAPVGVLYGYSSTLPTPLITLIDGPGSAPT
ncbi:hypothetical protein D3C71_1715270 [compost metagenome]